MSTCSACRLGGAAVLGLASSLGAAEIGDLTGNWTLAEFSGPTRLRKVFVDTATTTVRTTENSNEFARPGEEIVDAWYPDPVVAASREFAIDAGGGVSGGESGQVLSIRRNRILYAGDDGATTVYSNPGGDILLTSSRDEDQQDQTLCLRRPASLATAELAGDWRLVSLIQPDGMSKTQFEGKLADVYFIGEASLTQGDITINSLGGFSGLFSGTLAASGPLPGDFTVNAGGGPIPFRVNATKNLAVATVDDGDEEEYIVLVRKPAALATSELAGNWRASVLRFPTTLTEILYNVETEGGREIDSSEVAGPNEVLADLYHKEMPELIRLQLQVDGGGSFSALGGGSFTANGDRSVTLSLDGESISLQPNADKTFMVGGKADSDSHELIVLVKTADTVPAGFADGVDLQLVPAGGRTLLSWTSASDLCLEEASGSLSGWSEVLPAAGTDAYPVDPAAGAQARFFRVAERP